MKVLKLVKKGIIVVAIILGIFLLVSCKRPVESSVEIAEIPEGNDLSLEEQAEAVETCLEGWICIDNNSRNYLLTDCTINQSENCPAGCENSICKPVKTCTAGWKCLNEKKRSYLLESCFYENTTECDWKCEQGSCIPEPEALPEEIQKELVIIENKVKNVSKDMNYGELHTLTIDGYKYNLSIYFIDVGRVKLKIDDVKSDWLMESSTIDYNEITITVDYIILQPYAGGKQMIGYTVN
ncbi:MAG: hypothetical protein KKA62_05800 [Nanoarchaeota archaeon]|nr:hypothetical protein [Nanoarchaeota archaeon]MBU1643846.1 hypothetical protein [Nanoarchaeota archaeon]MBU1977438.1 hypothetical protein [Nanoarchaeota archaeon]